jgi:hypothetical protein
VDCCEFAGRAKLDRDWAATSSRGLDLGAITSSAGLAPVAFRFVQLTQIGKSLSDDNNKRHLFAGFHFFGTLSE